MTVWAVVVALAAAGCFAVSTALQHQGAAGTPAGRRWWRRLARRPGWVAGVCTGGVGFLLHAVALHLGTLVVVQALLVSGVVFALPVRAALERRAPGRLTMLWAVVTAAGLALFLVAVAPSPGVQRPDGGRGVLYVCVAAAVAAVATYGGTRVLSRRVRGLLWGSAAGILFGLTAGTVKMATATATSGGIGGIAGTWPPYALLVLGVSGLAVTQCAYRSAPLPVSMPLLNVLSPLVGIGFGAYVFGELPDARPVAVVLQLVALAVTAVGVTVLSRRMPRPRRTAAEPGPDPTPTRVAS